MRLFPLVLSMKTVIKTSLVVSDWTLKCLLPGIVSHTREPSTREVEAGWFQIQGKSLLHKETLSTNNKPRNSSLGRARDVAWLVAPWKKSKGSCWKWPTKAREQRDLPWFTWPVRDLLKSPCRNSHLIGTGYSLHSDEGVQCWLCISFNFLSSEKEEGMWGTTMSFIIEERRWEARKQSAMVHVVSSPTRELHEPFPPQVRYSESEWNHPRDSSQKGPYN